MRPADFCIASIYILSLTNIQLLANLSSLIVYLLVKLWISPLSATVVKKELSVEETKRLAQATAKEDEQFLNTGEDAENLDASSINGYAHAPHWLGVSSSSDDTFYETYSHFCAQSAVIYWSCL